MCLTRRSITWGGGGGEGGGHCPDTNIMSSSTWPLGPFIILLPMAKLVAPVYKKQIVIPFSTVVRESFVTWE